MPEKFQIKSSERQVSTLLTADYAQKYLGGKSLAAKIHWDMVPSDARAPGPENCLVVVTGSFAGFLWSRRKPIPNLRQVTRIATETNSLELIRTP